MTGARLKSLGMLGLSLLAAACLLGCNADVFLASEDGRLTLQIFILDDDEDDDTNDLTLIIGGEAEAVDVVVAREGNTGPVNLTLAGVPEGVEVEIQNPGILNQGRVTLQATGNAEPQTDVPVTITATDGQFNDFTQLTLDLVPWPGPSG